MRYIDRSIGALLLALIATTAGCATAPPSLERSPAAASAAASPAPRPEVARAFNAALAALRAGRLNDAERLFEALARAHPELSGPYANLGIVYYRSGKLDQSVEALTRAIRINPSHAAYHNALGVVYRQRGEFEHARSAYAKALAADPQYPKAHLNLGILYDLYLRDADKALHHYGRYQELWPSAEEPVAKWIVDLKQRRQAAVAQGGKGGSG